MNCPQSSFERLLHLLQCIAASPSPLSAKELVAMTGMPLSTLYRNLQFLVCWGAVTTTAGGRRYCSGPLGLQMALNYQQNNTLAMLAMPEMQRLARVTSETSALMVATGRQVVCVSMVESQQALCCSFSPGKGHPLLRGASALSLLAFMPREQSQETLDALLPANEHAAQHRQLESVRLQGYAESDSVLDNGVWGVSAPLLVGQGRLLGTLTLMAPSIRTHDRKELLIEQTRQAARRIGVYLSNH